MHDKITNPKFEKSENEIDELRKRIIHLEIPLKKVSWWRQWVSLSTYTSSYNRQNPKRRPIGRHSLIQTLIYFFESVGTLRTFSFFPF